MFFGGKTMKRIICIMVAMLLAVLPCIALTACNNDSENGSEPDSGKIDLKVGAILVGDETEGYTLAHMNGMTAAVEALKKEGKNVQIMNKKKVPESSDVKTNALDLIADGCTLIITNSYGHQFHFDDVIEKNPEVTFVAMTGDLAKTTSAEKNYTNYFNAFTDIYEARYVSGVIAGMKVKELVDNGTLTAEKLPESFDENGNIKIGYVGAFNYAEVVSGYTAFFLGVKSVVDNVVMTVKYTNSWFDEQREATVGEQLQKLGCVIIGQHADSTGAPAAIQKAYNQNNSLVCYSVGYNVDMLDVAPDVVLTSPTNNWEVYYETIFRDMIEGKTLPTDWSEGYAQNAVGITALGKACAAGTQEKVDETVKAIKDGTLKVFDCSKFTVKGEHLTSYTTAYGFEGNECIKTENGVTYFDETSLRSAPYFDIRIDGITEIAYQEDAE